MFKEGFENITNIDYSKYAVDIMKYKYRDYPPHFTCKNNSIYQDKLDELADVKDLSMY